MMNVYIKVMWKIAQINDDGLVKSKKQFKKKKLKSFSQLNKHHLSASVMHHSRTSMNIQEISKTYRRVKEIPNAAYSSFTLTDMHWLRTCHMREGRAGQWGGSLQWEVSNTRLSQRNRCLFRKQSCMALGLWLYCKDH